MDLLLWLMIVAAGSVGQFVDALAGMGFGAFSSTVMIAGGISPAVVVGTVSLAKVGSGLASGLSHWRFGNVTKAWVAPLAIPGIAGGVVAGLLITHLPEAVSRLWVPILLIVMGGLIIRRALSSSLDIPRVAGGSQESALVISRGPLQALRDILAHVPSNVWLNVIGFVGGVLNGLSGAFGPFATSSVLLLKRGHPRYAVGTVNFVEFFVAAAVSVTIVTQLDWAAFPWVLPLALMAGSVLAAPLGAYLARGLPTKLLAGVVGAVLIVLNIWSVLRAIA